MRQIYQFMKVYAECYSRVQFAKAAAISVQNKESMATVKMDGRIAERQIGDIVMDKAL